MENFGKFMTIVIVMITAPLINGFVFIKLWHWFVVPTFGLGELRLIEAIGLVALISFINAKKTNKQETDFWVGLIESIAYMVLLACFTLFFGWIISLFM